MLYLGIYDNETETKKEAKWFNLDWLIFVSETILKEGKNDTTSNTMGKEKRQKAKKTE